ncbi:MAG: tetratricopeptide repeat protein [Gammaproteobacteria bacterium]|nr:tetratricopeptide repeat protein [Gammaproteobacteria bacterium]
MVDRGTSRGAGGDGTGGRRLIGWKAIGQSLRCTERTARRWEAYRGMPVHRIPGGGRSSVWASPEELTSWLQALPSEVQETLRAEAGNDTAADATGSVTTPPDAAPAAAPPAAPAAAPPAAAAAAADAVADEPPATPVAPPAPASASRPRPLWPATALLVLALLGAGVLLWNSAHREPVPTAGPPRGPYDDNPESRETYMTARFELATRSADGLVAAEQAFQELTARYPDRAAGWSGLADAFLLLREFGSMPDEVAYPQAERAARTALALDPKLADAWLDQAFVAWWWHGEATSAFQSFNTALQLDPNSAKGLHWYATALYAHGDYAKALQTIGRARALDPNNRAIVSDEAWLRFGGGDRATGLATLERLTQLDPSFESSHYYLAHAYLIMGRDADFLREAKLAAQLRQQAETIDVLRLVERRYESGGRQAMLDQLTASEIERCERGTGSPVVVAEYRALAADRAGMLKWLENAATTHDHNLAPLRGYPEFAPYRSDPEFVRVVQRLP